MDTSSIPPHVVLMTLLLIATPLMMAFAIGCGMLRRRFAADALPAIPQFPGSSFPGVFDWLYTSFFVLITVMGTAAALFTPHGEPMTVGVLLLNLGLQVAVYLPFVIRFVLLPPPHRPSPGVGKTLLYLLLALMSIFIPSFFFETMGFYRWLMELTDCPELQDIVVMFRDGDWALRAVIALAAVVVAPICEEIVYRGFVYNMLKRYCTRLVAILLSALLFSVIHGAFAQVVPLALFGCVQCILYDKARSLWLPMTLHAIYNAISLCAILLLPC